MIAVARYERSPGSDRAEVAFVVEDAFQGRGLGSILLQALFVVARRYGICTFLWPTRSPRNTECWTSSETRA